jgi:hypothetical protein
LHKIDEVKKSSQKIIRNPNIVQTDIFKDKEDTKKHKRNNSFRMYQAEDLRPEWDFEESNRTLLSITK